VPFQTDKSEARNSKQTQNGKIPMFKTSGAFAVSNFGFLSFEFVAPLHGAMAPFRISDFEFRICIPAPALSA
jgi:hypothetical protein